MTAESGNEVRLNGAYAPGAVLSTAAQVTKRARVTSGSTKSEVTQHHHHNYDHANYIENVVHSISPGGHLDLVWL